MARFGRPAFVLLCCWCSVLSMLAHAANTEAAVDANTTDPSIGSNGVVIVGAVANLGDEDSVEVFLQHLGMQAHLEAFTKSGFDEVRYVRRMKAIDFMNLKRTHAIPDEDVKRLKEAVALLNPAANQTVIRQETPEEMRVREKLSYGRLYLNGSVSSLEYYRAHFGSIPVPASAPLVFADPFHGCSPLRNNVTGAIVVVRRGRCTFLDKAHNVSTANASAIVIVNMNEKIFRVSGGYALGDKPINVSLPSNLTVAMVKSSALSILRQAVSAGPDNPMARFVPLQCGEGRSICEPVTAADRAFVAATALDSGYLTIPKTGERFEFVSATFGGVMPLGEVPLTIPRPKHACGMVPKGPIGWAHFFLTRAAWDLVTGNGWPEDGARLEGKAVLVERGRCQLAYKALNIQRNGVKVMVVASRRGEPIEPFGATSKAIAKLQVPAIMVNHEAGERLKRLIEEEQQPIISLTVSRPGFAYAWLDLAHQTWPGQEDDHQDKAMAEEYKRLLSVHAHSRERLSFVKRSYEEETERRQRVRREREAQASDQRPAKESL